VNLVQAKGRELGTEGYCTPFNKQLQEWTVVGVRQNVVPGPFSMEKNVDATKILPATRSLSKYNTFSALDTSGHVVGIVWALNNCCLVIPC